MEDDYYRGFSHFGTIAMAKNQKLDFVITRDLVAKLHNL